MHSCLLFCFINICSILWYWESENWWSFLLVSIALWYFDSRWCSTCFFLLLAGIASLLLFSLFNLTVGRPIYPLPSKQDNKVKQPLQTSRPYNIAHRGSNGEIPEETAAAYMVTIIQLELQDQRTIEYFLWSAIMIIYFILIFNWQMFHVLLYENWFAHDFLSNIYLSLCSLRTTCNNIQNKSSDQAGKQLDYLSYDPVWSTTESFEFLSSIKVHEWILAMTSAIWYLHFWNYLFWCLFFSPTITNDNLDF